MKMTGNTILITGGGSGIGLGLAEQFKELGNEVLIAGRDPKKLKDAEARGFKVYQANMLDKKSVTALAQNAAKDFPKLNVVIHNAGIMMNENILKCERPHSAEDLITTNLLAPMQLTEALLPHLMKQKDPVIMTVTSGLAYLPLAMTPSYCASKAALHSYTMSLRYQLKDTPIQVLELAPPYVQTMLMGERQQNDPAAMPLKDFIAEVMTILKTKPEAEEILVGRVLPMRDSAEKGREGQAAFFKQFNDHMFTVRKGEH
jgi:uncharacterized oxidoreductase